jgi:hypothetical protein
MGRLGAAVGAEVAVGAGLGVNPIEGEASETGEVVICAEAVGPAVGESKGEPAPPPTQAASMRLEPARSPARLARSSKRLLIDPMPQVAPTAVCRLGRPKLPKSSEGRPVEPALGSLLRSTHFCVVG